MANTDNIVIGPVRVAFPKLFEGEVKTGEDGKSRTVYSTTVLIPKSAEGEKLKAQLLALAGQAVTKQWSDEKTRPRFRSPIHDADVGDDPEDGVPKAEKYDGFKGHWYFNLSSQFQPGILDKYKKPLVKGKDDQAIYGGVWLYLQLNAYTFDNKKKGVSFGLQNVMVARDDDKLGGGAPNPQDAFSAIPVAQATAGAEGNSLFQ